MTILPDRLARTCRGNSERTVWFERLPKTITELEARWSPAIGPPFEEAACAWVAPATRKDGARAVLKLAMPHMEARDEIGGLQFWSGDPTVRLLDSDSGVNAFADLLDLDCERVRLWTFARSAAEPREAWTDDSHATARALA